MAGEVSRLESELATARAELAMVRSSSVHVSVVADMMDKLKSANCEIKMFFDFLRSTGQVERFELWKCDSFTASACAQSYGEHKEDPS